MLQYDLFTDGVLMLGKWFFYPITRAQNTETSFFEIKFNNPFPGFGGEKLGSVYVCLSFGTHRMYLKKNFEATGRVLYYKRDATEFINNTRGENDPPIVFFYLPGLFLSNYICERK